MSQACGFDPNVAFAVTETPREWVSVRSVLLRKVRGIPSPLDLLPSMVSFKSSTLAVD